MKSETRHRSRCGGSWFSVLGSQFLVLMGLLYILLTLGLRIGEVCGLQSTDIDWGTQTLTIRRQAQDLKGGTVLRNETKTKAGRRVIPLRPCLFARLEARYATNKTSVFILTNDIGNMLSPTGFTRHFRGCPSVRKRKDGTTQATEGIRKKAKLGTHVTPHTFWHTMATGLKELANIEEIRADILGHGKTTTT